MYIVLVYAGCVNEYGVVVENAEIKIKVPREVLSCAIDYLYLLAIFMKSFLDFFIKHIFISNLYLF